MELRSTGGLEDQAGAGESGFGFLQFGNIERGDMEAARSDTRAGALEGRRENDGLADSERVGGVWLGGIDVHPIASVEKRRVEPGAVGEQRVVAERSDGGFQMEAGGHGNANDLVAVRCNDTRELCDAF